MSSPFASKLGTNYCPKDEERVEIESLLVEPTLRLSRLDEEIVDLQKAIDKLAAERETLGAFVDAHKALMSPTRRLPLDVLEAIFIACLPTHRNCVMSASEAPVLLGRICSDWRAISLSTPRLWASLHIVIPPSDDRLTRSFVAETVALRLTTTETWLARSGQRPLSISLFDSRSSPPPTLGPPAINSPFLRLLVQFAPRWQHILLDVPAAVLGEIRHLTGTDVPMLESLTINMTDSQPGIGFFDWNPYGILGGPRISSLAIPRQPEHFSRWGQLTALSIGGGAWGNWAGLAPEGILHAIAKCPELRCCKLMVSDSPALSLANWPPPEPHPTVELRFLHTLDIHCFANIDHTIASLLPRLSVPALEKFTLSGPTGEQSDHSLVPFITRSTKLEDFDINPHLLSKTHLLETIRSLPPTMKRLVISDPASTSFDDDTLSLLTPSPDSAAVCCPALRTLLIKDGGLLSDAALLRFIMARSAARMEAAASSTPLRRLQVEFDRQRTVDLGGPLAPFIKKGLEVSIVHSVHRSWSSVFSPWHGMPDEPFEPAETIGSTLPFPVLNW
ncbi:hypothetical protein C8R46DRAFT_955222 [Mycena filopes]|nr:hypothetical protein C8R46DRAFT_955222 [Mycena filopes]